MRGTAVPLTAQPYSHPVVRDDVADVLGALPELGHEPELATDTLAAQRRDPRFTTDSTGGFQELLTRKSPQQRIHPPLEGSNELVLDMTPARHGANGNTGQWQPDFQSAL